MDPVENIKPVIELAQKFGTLQAQQPIERTINDVPCLVGSFNGNVAPLVLPERLLPHPKRKRAKVELYEERSFIDYLNRHSRPGKTHVFGEADEAGGKFTAIIDYHQEERDPLAEASEQPEPKAPVIPGWGEHTVSFTLEVTPEWSRWISANGKLIAQETFAEFLQDNLDDVISPDPADLIDMAQGLIGRKDVTFASGKNLKSGAITLEYSEAITVNNTTNRRSDKFDVPDRFKIRVIPFVGGSPIFLEARLRFRIGNDGKLFFAFILNRPHQVIEQAFKEARENIEAKTKLPVFLGSGAITSA